MTKERCLLQEYLPDIHFQGSVHGVLLVILSSGEVYMFPLSEASPPPPPPSSSSKPCESLDVRHELREEFLVHRLSVRRCGVTVAPLRASLSPNKSLLLVHGEYEGDRRMLMVYQLVESFPSPLYLIFKDLCFSYEDCCFSPDSLSLVGIPSRHPSYLLLLSLPIIRCPVGDEGLAQPSSLFLNATAKKNLEHHLFSHSSPRISMQPRSMGPLLILGPAHDAFGAPFRMHCVRSNSFSHLDSYHYITWSRDEPQYVLWNVQGESQRFSWHPRLLCPRVRDRAWLSNPESPKTCLLDASFSSYQNGKLMLVVRREGYGRGPANGVGIQTCDAYPMDDASRSHSLSPWYRVSEDAPVLCCKWTKTLLLGTRYSAAVLVKGQGLFELVDHRCASSFQALNDAFVNRCSNFVQVGRTSRYWMTHSGELHAFVVQSAPESKQHPEWIDLVELPNQEKLTLRVLGRRVGYFIQDTRAEAMPATLESLYQSRKRGRRKKGSNKGNAAPNDAPERHDASGAIEAYRGMHLWKCWLCQVVVLKPLLCSQCSSVVYCSPACQELHHDEHKKECVH